MGTESGLRWALAFAPATVQLEGARGALIGTMSFDRVAFEGSEARNVAFELDLLALFTDTLSVEFLRIESLSLKKPATGGGGTIPLRIRLRDVEVKSVVYEGYELHGLRGSYAGSASVHEADASFSAAGARARLKLRVDERFTVEAEVKELNIAVLDPSAPQTALEVSLKGQGTAADFAGNLAVSNPDPGPVDRERLPFSRAHGVFQTNFERVRLEQVDVAMHPTGRLHGSATASLESVRLELKVQNIDLRGLYSTLHATRLAGSLSLQLNEKAQRVKGTLAQDDMTLSADAERKGDDIEVRALHARAGEAEARGSGRVHLGEPLRFAAELTLSRFNPARFGDYPRASINGYVKAHGDLGRRGTAQWRIADSTLLGEPFASSGSAGLVKDRVINADAWATLGRNRAAAKGSFGGPGDRAAWTLHVPELAALAPQYAGEVHAHGTASGTWKAPSSTVQANARALRLGENIFFERASANASGTLENHAGTVTASGSGLDLRASLQGGWKASAWRGEIESLTNAGKYPFELKSAATLEAGGERVALGPFRAELAGARLAVESLRWENDRLSSRGALSALAVRGLVPGLEGNLELDGEWDLVSTPKLNGRLALRRARGDAAWGGQTLELSSLDLAATLNDDRVAANAQIASRFGAARIEGSTAGITPDSAIAFTAEVQITELRTLTEPLWTQARVSGRLSASLKIAGTISAPTFSGVVRGDALGFDMPPWGIALRDGAVRAELDADTLRVTEARIAGGDGSFSATGTLPLGLKQAATLEWKATRFQVFGRPDRRLVVSGSGTAASDGKRFTLRGALAADSGRFEIATASLPDLEPDVEVDGELPAQARKGVASPLELDLALDLGQRLTLRAYGYDGGVTGKVRVTSGPAGELRAHGRLEALKGRYRAYGQELDVDPGALIFAGPIDAPGLDISAWRRHQQVEAGIHLTGTLQTPRIELISNPPVNDSEKLSWLVLGRAPTDASGADLAVLQAASGAVFGRGGELPFHRKFAARLGFDELTVRSSSELSSNVVALGKRYSDDIYFSFEQAIGTTTEYLVKLDYALTRRFSLRGQTGTTSGVGVFYRYAWD